MRYYVGFDSQRHRKPTTFSIKSVHTSRTDAGKEARRRCNESKKNPNWITGEIFYYYLSETQLAERREKEAAKMTVIRQSRKEEGIAKRKKELDRKKKLGISTTPNFVTCPTCGAKSKKLYSEMGGLQSRRCANGHYFEYDKNYGGMTRMIDRPYFGDPDRGGYEGEARKIISTQLSDVPNIPGTGNKLI